MKKGGVSWTPVVAGILLRKGKFLAVKRPPGKVLAGFWEFPGGKLEQGETPEEALIRELREEIGVVPVEYVLWKEKKKEYKEIRVQLHFFLIPRFDGRPVALEGQKMDWLTVEEAGTKKFLEADLEIVQSLSRIEKHTWHRFRL